MVLGTGVHGQFSCVGAAVIPTRVDMGGKKGLQERLEKRTGAVRITVSEEFTVKRAETQGWGLEREMRSR